MRKVKLFIATTLDGYIAGLNGEIDWLFDDADYGYKEFYASIDTMLMGNSTYKQVLTFGEFPHNDKENFVFTRNINQKNDKNVTYISKDIGAFVADLKMKSGKDIWLVGGGEINSILLSEDLIDEMIISIHPILLGAGIPLFKGPIEIKRFKLIEYKTFPSGLTQVTYAKI